VFRQESEGVVRWRAIEEPAKQQDFGNIVLMPNQPLVSIDAVPMIMHEDSLHVVLGVRENNPFAGQAALPGVLLSAHERVSEAVLRALLSKAGVQESQILSTVDVGVFDDFERDERGPTLSITRMVILDGTSVLADPRVRLVRLNTLPQLPFDHASIVAVAAGVLLDALWINMAATRALLGPSFNTAAVIARQKELALAAGRAVPESANVGRSLQANKLLQRVTGPTPAGGRGRPPALWEWVGEKRF
jgi:8-oxo-dGTP diphosphatase